MMAFMYMHNLFSKFTTENENVFFIYIRRCEILIQNRNMFLLFKFIVQNENVFYFILVSIIFGEQHILVFV